MKRISVLGSQFLCIILFIALIITVVPVNAIAATNFWVKEPNKIVGLSPDANTPVPVNADIVFESPNVVAFRSEDTLTVSFPSGVTVPEGQISIDLSNSQGIFRQDMFTVRRHQDGSNIDIVLPSKPNPLGFGPDNFTIHIGSLIITDPGDIICFYVRGGDNSKGNQNSRM